MSWCTRKCFTRYLAILAMSCNCLMLVFKIDINPFHELFTYYGDGCIVLLKVSLETIWLFLNCEFYFFYLNNIKSFIIFLLLFKYSGLHFPPTTLPCLTHPHLLPSSLALFCFVLGSFIHVPGWRFPFFPPLSPCPLPSGSCQFVLSFHASDNLTFLTNLSSFLNSIYL